MQLIFRRIQAGTERAVERRAMKKLAAYGIRLGAIGVAAALCTGCPNPQTYGTPRTTPVGKVQHSVAAEGIGTNDAGAIPTLPTYTLRVGVADTVDIGARIANLSSIGADVKWNFIKSDVFDMALDPGFQLVLLKGVNLIRGVEGVNAIYLNGPLMFGINVSDSVSIVPTLGGGVWYRISTAGTDSAIFMLRPGIGFDFRISERFALHPEITFLKTLNGSNEDLVGDGFGAHSLLPFFGLGFNFGNLPKYGGG
jgi:hypothetical protein